MSAKEDLRAKVERVLAEVDAQRGLERGKLFRDDDRKRHYHKCPDENCGHIWGHRVCDFNSSADFINGHKCPKCKSEQTIKCRRDGTSL